MLHTIRWKFTVAFLLLIAITIGLLDLYLSNWADRYYVTQLRLSLSNGCNLVSHQLLPLLQANPPNLDAPAKSIATDLHCRVTVIRPDGKVIGESDHDRTTMELHNTRPEVRGALLNGNGWSQRPSTTLHQRMLYVAQRIAVDGKTVGVIRLAVSLDQVNLARGQIHQVLLLTALLAILFAGLAGILVSGRITRPIQRMISVVRQFGQGEFAQQIEVRPDRRDEISELGMTLNKMSAELRAMMGQLTAEKRKLQAILHKTDDGLMFVDANEYVQILNPAAARLLGVDRDLVIGRTVIAATFNTQFTELINHVLRTKSPGTLDILLNRSEQVMLNVYVTPLEYSDGVIGALAVMHDLTEIRRTDEMRKDFVANVSHELRTPLATVRAMAETIALRVGKAPQVADEYARKIICEVDRLSAVSDDLLDLAHIESGRQSIHTVEIRLADLVSAVLTNLEPLAREKNITLLTEVQDDLQLVADHDAVEQILINLVDNAVKYTPTGGTVKIRANSESEHIAIAVVDTGIGIPAADLSRIFERFYRVDKARSRASGGTGLGLAIVKHLVESQGGKISVESTPGIGSTFTFTLPQQTMTEQQAPVFI